MTPETVMDMADKASSHSDRWMFMAMLIVILMAFGLFTKWILGDRKAIGDRLTQITDRHIQQTERLAEVVANNTQALKDVSEQMHWCRESNRGA